MKLKKWSYLGPWTSNQKNKTTLFSSILKVEGNKVVLLFWIDAQEPRYGRFLIFYMDGFKNGTSNGSYLLDKACVGHMDPSNELYKYQVGPWATNIGS